MRSALTTPLTRLDKIIPNNYLLPLWITLWIMLVTYVDNLWLNFSAVFSPSFHTLKSKLYNKLKVIITV